LEKEPKLEKEPVFGDGGKKQVPSPISAL